MQIKQKYTKARRYIQDEETYFRRWPWDSTRNNYRRHSYDNPGDLYALQYKSFAFSERQTFTYTLSAHRSGDVLCIDPGIRNNKAVSNTHADHSPHTNSNTHAGADANPYCQYGHGQWGLRYEHGKAARTTTL